MSETQGGGLIREQFPPNTTPARARETELQRVVDLLVNYFCLMFRYYF